MSLTRANVEAILVRRVGKLLTAAGLDGTTVNGTNADLSDPIAVAVLSLGGTVASRVSVADADVATIGTDDEPAMLDIAELRGLERIASNLDLTDITVGERTEKLGQLGDRLEKLIARKRADVARIYGIGLCVPEGGVIALDFAQHNETV